MSITTINEVRSAIIDGVNSVLSMWFVSNRLKADQMALLKAVRNATIKNDQFCSEVLSELPSCYNSNLKENNMDHQKMQATLNPFNIDVNQLISDLKDAIVKDTKLAVQDVLSVIQTAFNNPNNNEPCHTKMQGTAWQDTLNKLLAALKANMPQVLPLVIQILISALSEG